MPSRKQRGEGLFCHYMAQIGGNFRPKSAHRSKFPWDGSADPWDGNRNPWDGSTEKPLPAAFPTLKGGRRWPSALTVCHIAHTAWAGKITRFGRKGETPHNALTRLARKGYPPRRDAIHRVSPARGRRPSYTASRHPLRCPMLPLHTWVNEEGGRRVVCAGPLLGRL